MKEPLYIQAITQSWHIVWKHKILWIFGLFAAFLGQAGIGDLFYKLIILGFKNPVYLDTFFIPKAFLELFLLTIGLPLSAVQWFAVFWLFLILFGIIFFFVFIALISQGTIIHAVAQDVREKKNIDFDMAWHKGVSHAGRLFFINALKKGLILFVTSFVVLSILTVFTKLNALTLVSFIFVLIFALFVGIIVSFLAIYAAAYVVVEEYSFTDSLVAAWRLFSEHVLVSVEVGLIVLILNFVFMLSGFALLFLFFFIPIAAFWFLSILTGIAALKLTGIVFASILSLLCLMFVGSVFTSFTTAVWTYLFMKMHKEGVKSRLIHFFEKIKR